MKHLMFSSHKSVDPGVIEKSK